MKKSISALVMMVIIGMPFVVAAEEGKVDVPSFMRSISENTTFSGLIETNLVAGRDLDKKNYSDLSLATAQFGLDSQLSEGVRGHLLFLWEEDDTEPVDLDEGTITLGATETMPAYLTVGRM